MLYRSLTAAIIAVILSFIGAKLLLRRHTWLDIAASANSLRVQPDTRLVFYTARAELLAQTEGTRGDGNASRVGEGFT